MVPPLASVLNEFHVAIPLSPSLGFRKRSNGNETPLAGPQALPDWASRRAPAVIDQSYRGAGPEEVGVAQHPVIGYLVWALLFGALFAWEGLALSHISGVPTLSATFRAIMRYPFGRWALFALWLWFGWHIFVRGWHFLLRA
jgi:hypothetical protein